MIKKMIIGLISGMICGLFSAGGGLILVPAFLYLLKMEPAKARATASFCILPMVMVTAFFYGQSNLIHWQVGILCAVGGALGGAIGAKLLNTIPDNYLRIVFLLFLSYAGIKMLL